MSVIKTLFFKSLFVFFLFVGIIYMVYTLLVESNKVNKDKKANKDNKANNINEHTPLIQI